MFSSQFENGCFLLNLKMDVFFSIENQCLSTFKNKRKRIKTRFLVTEKTRYVTWEDTSRLGTRTAKYSFKQIKRLR